MKKTLGALAMSCALAFGMSVPAFAAQETTGNTNVKTTLKTAPVEINVDVPTDLAFTIHSITPGQVCNTANLPKKGDIQIKNNSGVPLYMKGIGVEAGSDNTANSVFRIVDLTDPDKDYSSYTAENDALDFSVRFSNDEDEGFMNYVQPVWNYPQEKPVSIYYFSSQSAAYGNFAVPFPTNNAFTIDVQRAAVYVRDNDESKAKILDQAKNYFNLTYTLSVVE